MNKGEMITAVAAKSGLSKKNAEAAVNAFFACIQDALKKGEKVSVMGFGSFEVKTRAAREGINPLTKAKIKIPATKVPAFKAGKALKDAVK